MAVVEVVDAVEVRGRMLELLLNRFSVGGAPLRCLLEAERWVVELIGFWI